MLISLEPTVIKIKSRISIAGSYLKTLEKSLPTAQKVAIDELRAKAKANSWGADDYFSDLSNLEHDFEEIPNLAGSAFIAYVNGLVEHGLTSVCDRLHEKKHLPLRIQDLNGSLTERAKIYLTKLAGIKVGNNSWQNLNDLAILRHAILHAGGEVRDSRKVEEAIQRIRKRYPEDILIKDFDVFGGREINVTLSLCKKILLEVETFFDQLFSLLNLKGVTVDEK